MLRYIDIDKLVESFTFYRSSFENYFKAVIEENMEQIMEAVLDETLSWRIPLHVNAESIINQLSFVELDKLLNDVMENIIFSKYFLLDAIKKYLEPMPLHLFEHEIAKYINVDDVISQVLNLSPFGIAYAFLSAVISSFIPSDEEVLAYAESEEFRKWLLEDRRRLDNLRYALALLKLGLLGAKFYDAVAFYVQRVFEDVIKTCYRRVAGRDPPEKETTGTILNELRYLLRCKNNRNNTPSKFGNPSELCCLFEDASKIYKNERNPIIHNQKFIDHYSEAWCIFSLFLQVVDGIIAKCRHLLMLRHKSSEADFYDMQLAFSIEAVLS
jgi:hypothetical protein